ncbi:hypothetical protein IW140_003452 [Coemansia sp. RSA 1813]|nr:hypothetical protein EV178_000852 [Coemansia sp. RSA 1646]KAJ2088430.1 hypothetical protein IW138_004208 [Coemansia sp. RSA 986]KAJ2213523.1 hypothetical protein EV179_003748 [Coemansia sp. RSA 487]KAJ2568946.1 hypothetical protein IW140_003452 [Coemansia sp. RSA 1813]
MRVRSSKCSETLRPQIGAGSGHLTADESDSSKWVSLQAKTTRTEPVGIERPGKRVHFQPTMGAANSNAPDAYAPDSSMATIINRASIGGSGAGTGAVKATRRQQHSWRIHRRYAHIWIHPAPLPRIPLAIGPPSRASLSLDQAPPPPR